ncbi:MAG: hypothetical protein QXH75_02825 [Sulfolobaceae archaeon]
MKSVVVNILSPKVIWTIFPLTRISVSGELPLYTSILIGIETLYS